MSLPFAQGYDLSAVSTRDYAQAVMVAGERVGGYTFEISGVEQGEGILTLTFATTNARQLSGTAVDIAAEEVLSVAVPVSDVPEFVDHGATFARCSDRKY